MGQVKAVITDFDGTLVNTIKANMNAYTEAFNACGYIFDKENYKKFFGLRFNEMCDALNVPIENREKIKRIKKEVYPKYFSNIQLNTSLLLAIIRFHNSGCKTCIASTASKDNLYNVLNYFKIKKYFDYIITGEDVEHGKPNPEVYLKALEQCRCSADEAIIYEDSEVGIEAAKAANVKYIKIEIENNE